MGKSKKKDNNWVPYDDINTLTKSVKNMTVSPDVNTITKTIKKMTIKKSPKPK